MLDPVLDPPIQERHGHTGESLRAFKKEDVRTHPGVYLQRCFHRHRVPNAKKIQLQKTFRKTKDNISNTTDKYFQAMVY